MFKNIFIFKAIFCLLVLFLSAFFIADIRADYELLSEHEPQCLLRADKILISPGDTFQLTIIASHPSQAIKEVLYYDPRGWQPNYYCGSQKCTRSWWVNNDNIGTFEYKGGFYAFNNEWIACDNQIVIEVAEALPEDIQEPKEDVKPRCVLKTEPAVIEKRETFYLTMEASHPDGIKYAEFAETPDEYIGRTNCHNHQECSAQWLLQENKSGSYQYWAGFLTSQEEWFECRPAFVDVKDNFNIIIQSKMDGYLEEGVEIKYGFGLWSRLTSFLLSSWHPGTQVFRAPETYQKYEFSHWSDCTLRSGRDCNVTVGWWPFKRNKTVTAHYVSLQPDCSIGSWREVEQSGSYNMWIEARHPAGVDSVSYRREDDIWSDPMSCGGDYTCLAKWPMVHNELGEFEFFGRFKSVEGEWIDCNKSHTIRVVKPAPEKRTLFLYLEGDGSGYVNLDPPDIDYHRDDWAFNERYNQGTWVTLTARPEAGSVFLGWEGDCPTGASTCVLKMDSSKSVTAEFGKMGDDHRFLMVNIEGKGQVDISPAGIHPYNGPHVYLYNKGEKITLRAAEELGSEFLEWTGDCSGSSKTCVLEMTETRDVEAIFESKDYGENEYILSVFSSGPGRIKVDPPGKPPFDGPTIHLYEEGEVVALTAVADDNAKFIGWDEDCSGEENVCVLEMVGDELDKTARAVFEYERACEKLYGNGPIGIELIAVPLDNEMFFPKRVLDVLKEMYELSSFEELKQSCGLPVFSSDEVKNKHPNWTIEAAKLPTFLDHFPPFNPNDFTVYRSDKPYYSECRSQAFIVETVYLVGCDDLYFAFAWLNEGISVLSTGPQSSQDILQGLLAHELGHSFGGLCDEYILEGKEPFYDCCGCFQSSTENNCPEDWVGCYPGCNYQTKDWYRETTNSIMRSCYFPGCEFAPNGFRKIENIIKQRLGK